jgi:diacylglycerol kinase family enzyme
LRSPAARPGFVLPANGQAATPLLVLFLNPVSGSADDALVVLERAAGQRGIEVRDVRECDPSGAEIVGAAGGDGSLAGVAQVALERDLPLVVVPMGTRNHFAKDLGLDPDDPVAALAAFDGGGERRVDVGRVNGRVFLNNVSLGAYAAAVHDEGEGALGPVARGLLRFRRHPLKLVVDGEERSLLILLVGNNEYDGRGTRDRLDGGTLSAYLLEHDRRLRFHRESRAGTHFTVRARSPRVQAAIDGEPVELDSPLHFELEPRALRVKVIA